MVGGILLDLCLNSDEIGAVTHFSRKSSGREHNKLTELTGIDLNNLPENAASYTDIDCVFFCIGVYTGAVPREQFRQITVDYPMAIAERIKKHSPHAVYCLLSGQGADRSEKSRMAFAKDKGIVENRLSAMGLGRFHTFRPAYIYPVEKRKEPNLSYRISRRLYPLIKVFGKNASVKSTELAQAMFNVALSDSTQEVFENKEILDQA